MPLVDTLSFMSFVVMLSSVGILDMALDDVGSSLARGLTISGVIINEILEVTSGTAVAVSGVAVC